MPDLDSDISSALESAASSLSGQPAAETTPTTDAPKTEAASQPASAADASVTASTAPGSTAPASATETPKPETTPKDDPAAPPQEKWQHVLGNAREKAARETEAKLHETYGIPRGADPNTVRRFISGLHHDPVALYHELGRQLKPYLEQPKATFQRPTPRLRAEDGTAAYAAEDVDALIQQLQDTFEQRLTGAIEPLEAERQQSARAHIWNEAVKTADERLAEAREWEGFAELSTQIAELMEQDGRITLDSAYNRLVQPWRKERDRKLKEETRQQVLQEIKKAPVNSPSVVPGAPVRAGNGAKRSRSSFDSDVEAAVQRANALHG